jgi:hypothetical protein
MLGRSKAGSGSMGADAVVASHEDIDEREP